MTKVIIDCTGTDISLFKNYHLYKLLIFHVKFLENSVVYEEKYNIYSLIIKAPNINCQTQNYYLVTTTLYENIVQIIAHLCYDELLQLNLY